MSFFFDVWTLEGFVLASDVRLLVNGKPEFAHKIARSSPSSRIVAATAVCGDFPDICLNLFHVACNTKDTLREIAQSFAERWTDRFAGTCEYSAVHLVGFGPIPGSSGHVPQVWYWCNWAGANGFYSKEKLLADFDSFAQPIPENNHIPWKVRELTGKFPGPSLEEEGLLVTSFLQLHQPFFTWNGDTQFWRSAADAVGSAMTLLWRHKPTWTIKEAAELTTECLAFLARVGRLLPASSVGLINDREFDVLKITSDGIQQCNGQNCLPNQGRKLRGITRASSRPAAKSNGGRLMPDRSAQVPLEYERVISDTGFPFMLLMPIKVEE